MKRLLTGAALAVSALLSTVSQAAVIPVLSPALMTTTYLNDFETVLNSGPVTFNPAANRLTKANAGNPGTSSGVWGMASTAGQPITATLSSTFNAVGLIFGNDDLCCAPSFNAVLSVYSGANFLGSVQVPANMNDAPDQFIGLYSTVAFDRVVFDYTAPGLTRYIDDFRLGTSVVSEVPEPATAALLGLGLLGFAASRRRRS